MDLFTQPHVLARNSDPETSLIAAREMAATGQLGNMELTALNLVLNNPGWTSAELEKRHGFERGQIGKRLSTLVNNGRVIRGDKRRCEITGKLAFTHYTKPHKPR
tara:strand:+ start:5346 stop:5660 length:315 start_codon:yes stop_codon:yes gene_type:complete